MGGSYETHLSGPDNLRIHESDSDVHVHDDVRGTKLVMPAKQFKKEHARLRKELLAQQPPYEASMVDANDVRLVGELDVDQIEWRLETGKPGKSKQAAPVLVGIIEIAAARARRRSLCGKSWVTWSFV